MGRKPKEEAKVSVKEEAKSQAKTEAKEAPKSVKKATPKKEKDLKKDDKKKSGPEYSISLGLPDVEYRRLPDPTWHALFSTIFGTPGFVKGKIYEFAGESDVGKSALASTIIAMLQRAGETAFYVDAERSLNKDFAKLLGYDVGKLLWVKPDNGEAAFQGLRHVVNNMGGTVGILDSTGACTPKSMVEDAGNAMGALARLTSQEMPKVDKVIDNHNATLIVISQVKIKPGVTFGDPKYVTGGSAVGFHTRFRCKLSSADTIKDKTSGQVTGFTVRIRVTKNHTGPKRTTPFDIRVDHIFRPQMAETAAVWAKQFGLIDKQAMLVAGKFPFVGAGDEKQIVAAVRGHEAEIFDAVNELFKSREAGKIVEFSETEDDMEELVDSTEENDELKEVVISEEELADAGTL